MSQSPRGITTATDIAKNKARIGTESFIMSKKNVGEVRVLKYTDHLAEQWHEEYQNLVQHAEGSSVFVDHVQMRVSVSHDFLSARL